jgi:hypothetical protein
VLLDMSSANDHIAIDQKAAVARTQSAATNVWDEDLRALRQLMQPED